MVLGQIFRRNGPRSFLTLIDVCEFGMGVSGDVSVRFVSSDVELRHDDRFDWDRSFVLFRFFRELKYLVIDAPELSRRFRTH